LPSRWSGARSNWSEGPRGGLETKLPSLFEELERRAAEDDRRAAEHARCEEQWRREWQQRLERERRARVIKDRVERLSGEIASWRLAEETLEYVAALRGGLAQLEAADRDRVSAWCDWAEAWSRETDPTLNVAGIGGLDGQRSDDAERARLASPY
jgi:hypothetical protein